MAVDEKEKAGRRERGEKVENPDTDHWRSAFPANITVDELYLYRKKRPDASCLNDNLKIEEGSFNALKSEYTRRFKNPYEVFQSLNISPQPLFTSALTKPKVSLKLEGEPEVLSEYNEKFSNRAMQGYPAPIHEIIDKSLMENNSLNRLHSTLGKLDTEKTPKSKRRLFKRRTNLLLDGDFSHLTEYAEKFIEFLLSGRVKLCRTPTTLKLGLGSMDSKTETHDQYINFEKFERPTLCKKFTQLHLEGNQDNHTENQEKFLPHEIEKRPPLVKKLTNLHLEGDQLMIPEYKQQYVSYNSLERPKKFFPVNNLKPGGVFEEVDVEKMSRRDIHPLIPHLRESFDKHDDGGDKIHKQSRRSSLKRANEERTGQEDMLGRASSHTNLGSANWPAPDKNSDIGKRKSRSSMTEKNAYLEIDEPQKGSSSDKSRTGLSYMKGDGKMDGKPEYSTSFVEFPRERPSVMKPKSQLSPEGEVRYVSEQVDKYIPHTMMEKTEPFRRVSELKMEGKFECQPEYRKAYIDYLIKEKKPPIAQRRRILEITENERNVTSPSENLSSSDTIEKLKPTTPKKKPKRNLATSDTSSGTSSPKPTKLPSRRLSQIEDAAFGKKEPPPTQRKTWAASLPKSKLEIKGGRRSRDVSPAINGNWRAQEANGSVYSDSDGWISPPKEDPAFLIIDEGKEKRNNSFKDQKVKLSWQSVQ